MVRKFSNPIFVYKQFLDFPGATGKVNPLVFSVSFRSLALSTKKE